MYILTQGTLTEQRTPIELALIELVDLVINLTILSSMVTPSGEA